MKKASHILLTVEKVFDIITLVLLPFLSLILIIFGVVFLIRNGATETEEQLALYVAGWQLLGSGIGVLFALPFPIISLVFVNKALYALENANSREEARTGAILGIVAGALGNNFGIPAGIMMLCMKDETYQQKIIEQ